MLYEINDIGIKELKKRIKENNKLLFIFPFISVIYIILTYISMRGSLFFWITSPFLIILFIFIGIVSPVIAANRFNKVITKLQFENDGNIRFETGKINFKKEKTYKISPFDIKSINERKLAYGSGLANGLLIRLHTNEDLYLIEKFCSEFQTVKAEMKNKINTGANNL